MVTIFTHVNPDLDAAASVWAWTRFFSVIGKEPKVVFVPAAWDGSTMQDGDVALDIPAGGKGIKGEKADGGKVLSCFATVMKMVVSEERIQKGLLDPLIEFIDVQDSTGDAFFNILSPRFSVGLPTRLSGALLEPAAMTREDVPTSLRVTGLTAVFRAIAHMAKGDHQKTIDTFSVILDGMYGEAVDHKQAAEHAKGATWFGKHIALIHNSTPKTSGALFEQGARFVVYVDGPNMGVIRSHAETTHLKGYVLPIVQAMAAQELGEWFFHPAGFLACRGGLKSPVQTPSAIKGEELAAKMARVLNDELYARCSS
jgi:hypothetical protein